ncbi:hypothetical protein VI817_008963 [Penicillium citrinum]|nr:hypothetical protein VI817_008963 [Penicillium citrinum]
MTGEPLALHAETFGFELSGKRPQLGRRACRHPDIVNPNCLGFAASAPAAHRSGPNPHYHERKHSLHASNDDRQLRESKKPPDFSGEGNKMPHQRANPSFGVKASTQARPNNSQCGIFALQATPVRLRGKLW